MSKISKNDVNGKGTKGASKVSAAQAARDEAQATARNILWGYLGKVAGKEFDRDGLAESTAHKVTATVIAQVDGEDVEISVGGGLNVGGDSIRASSAGPDNNHLIGYLLSLLPKTRRDAVLATLPEEFAAAGGELPVIEEGYMTAAEMLLGKLRAKKEQPVRGSVSAVYQISE